MSIKLFSLAKELNIGVNSLVAFLHDKGKEVDNNPNTRITDDEFNLILRDFTPTFDEETVGRAKKKFLRSKSTPKAKPEEPTPTAKPEASSSKEQPTEAKAPATAKEQAEPDIPTAASASQLNVVGKIELDKHNNPVSVLLPRRQPLRRARPKARPRARPRVQPRARPRVRRQLSRRRLRKKSLPRRPRRQPRLKRQRRRLSP
nr:translation initiation factor IF-2 N-terminal domain-containing protein [Porphyromonas uenonis]